MSDVKRFEPLLIGIALCLVVIIAASRLFDPFSGDQALFFIGAKVLHQGGALYKDYWDIKQPAIFGFFLVACDVFGFNQSSPHVLDLLWQGALSVALIVALRSSLRDARWAAFAPLAVVGAMYAGSAAWHLLQVEELVGAPLFLCVWAAMAAMKTQRVSRPLAFASGLCASIVLLFKFVLLPLVICVLAASVARSFVNRKGTGLLPFLSFWALGMSIPLLSFVLYAISSGSAEAALFTTFIAPLEIARFAPHAPLDRLYDAGLRLTYYFRGIIALAALGAVVSRRPTARTWRDISLAWILAGSIVIVCQVDSWWQYQFLLIVPPIGILATFGADYLGEQITRGGRATVFALAGAAVACYIAVPLPQGAIGTVLRVIRERPFRSQDALARYRVATSSEYAGGASDADVHLPSIGDGSIYVFGNPLIYVLTNRSQAIAMTNWASYLDSPAIWSRLDREFAETEPEVVFVLKERLGDVLSSKSPRSAVVLSRDYTVLAQTTDGQWFVKRSANRHMLESRRI